MGLISDFGNKPNKCTCLCFFNFNFRELIQKKPMMTLSKYTALKSSKHRCLMFALSKEDF